MRIALVMGTFGAFLTYWVGTHFCGLSTQDVVMAVLISNLSAFVTVLSVLALERQSDFRRRFMGSFVQVWAFMGLFYFGILLSLVPALREWKTLAILLLPLLLSIGWMLPLFGIAQDKLIARVQRKALENKKA
jgi:predicted exporter